MYSGVSARGAEPLHWRLEQGHHLGGSKPDFSSYSTSVWEGSATYWMANKISTSTRNSTKLLSRCLLHSFALLEEEKLSISIWNGSIFLYLFAILLWIKRENSKGVALDKHIMWLLFKKGTRHHSVQILTMQWYSFSTFLSMTYFNCFCPTNSYKNLLSPHYSISLKSFSVVTFIAVM